MPVCWETHSSPEMGDRPQAIVNRQVLSDSDLLIAVFWTRLGSPTGEAQSGTVEEIEEHRRAGKPAMIYFSSAPVLPDSVDSGQYQALKTFKDSCRKRGLIEEYENLSQFREKLVRQLAQTIIRNFTADEVNLADLPVIRPDPIPSISSAARELLLEATQDTNGVIMRLQTHGGTSVVTHGRNFVSSSDARETARWRSAVDELYRQDMIEDRTGKGEVFFVTDQGYIIADRLRDQSPA
ncbi:conserved protein of unknown function [Nitrospira japonica]|uniref:DUF4062 domain-containing protein n=2 Tax=Nitrospira japonica TaxID=1325564 RepID=A0A1W1I4W5_9BACT|nr:conserved protein of unknown function [Nitrospira japonica]